MAHVKLGDSGRIVAFAVAADLAEVEQETHRFNVALAWSLSALGFGLILAVFIQVRFGLRPLRRIGRALADIRGGRADSMAGDYPDEVLPLVDELNKLLAHNAQVVERARTHVGNLAHALKTPLSVLTNEAAAGRPSAETVAQQDRKSTRLNSSHTDISRMPSSA